MRANGWTTKRASGIVLLLLAAWFSAACQGALVPLVTPAPTAEERPTPVGSATVPIAVVSPTRTASRPSPTVGVSPTASASTPTVLTSPIPQVGQPALTSAATSPSVPVPRPTVSPSPTPPGETPTPAGECDLALDKSVAPVAGTTSFLVTVTVQHRGSGPCSAGALVNDPLPAGFVASAVRVVEAGGQGNWECSGTRCRAGTPLRPGYTATFTFTVSGEAGSATENCAVVSVTLDGHPENDSRCVTLGPVPTPVATATPLSCLFGLEKAMEAGQPGAAGQVPVATVVIRLQNTGPEQCRAGWSEFVLTDELPPGMVVQSVRQVSGAGWSCMTSERVVECTGTPPPTGAQVVVTLEVLVQESARRAVNCVRVEPLGMQACATLM